MFQKVGQISAPCLSLSKFDVGLEALCGFAVSQA